MLKLWIFLTELRHNLRRDDRGISALEYAVLAALVIAAVVGALTLFSERLETIFETLFDTVDDAVGVEPGEE